MPDYRSRLFMRVLGKDLDDTLVSVAERKSTPTKPVKTMNKKNRARGVKRAASEYTLDVDAEPIDDPSIPDWDKLRELGTPFTIGCTPDVGAPYEYDPCYVSEVQDNTSDGDSSKKLTIIALGRK